MTAAYPKGGLDQDEMSGKLATAACMHGRVVAKMLREKQSRHDTELAAVKFAKRVFIGGF
jgi:hypothetical protein